MRAAAYTGLGGLALLALGCGGHALTHDAGASGAGGAPGTGGVPGGVFFTAGCPIEFAPCGGDVVGTWRSDPKCKPMMQSTQAFSSCEGEAWDLDGVTTTVTWTFAADQTFTVNISTEGPVTVTSPQACLVDGNGLQIACTADDAGERYAGSIFLSGGAPGAPACDTPPAACHCTIPFVPAPLVLAGTYTTVGSTLTLSLAGGLGDFPTDYCVSGNVFDIASQIPLLPRGDFFRQ